MTDSYNVGYSVDALGDLREIYSYVANELLVPETAAAQLGVYERKFVHWISCQLVIRQLNGSIGIR